jgi:hypothetical protein
MIELIQRNIAQARVHFSRYPGYSRPNYRLEMFISSLALAIPAGYASSFILTGVSSFLHNRWSTSLIAIEQFPRKRLYLVWPLNNLWSLISKLRECLSRQDIFFQYSKILFGGSL